jgi:hypothetical protein
MVNDCRLLRSGDKNLGIFLRPGGFALLPEELIAHKLYETYGPAALDQAMTCARLARAMADWPSTTIWNKVIAILTERRALPLAG